MKKKGKIIAITSLSLLGTVALSFSGVTLAKYIKTSAVGQLVSRAGVENTSLFLNANIWNSGVDENGDPVTPTYFMWVITGSKGILVPSTKHVTPTVSATPMDLYVFEYTYEWKSASRNILFIRANSSAEVTSYKEIDFPTSAVWNQTPDIAYSDFIGHSNAYNYVCIDNWSGGADSKSGYSINKIVKNGYTLTWLN